MRSERVSAVAAGVFVMLAGLAGISQAEVITIPNASFELPMVVRDETNPFGALPYIDDWDETAVGPADEFDQNTGAFLNTDPLSSDHITNADGNQLAFVSTLIGNDLRQQLATTFVPGQRYHLTVGVASSFNFPPGADEQLELALFYRDGDVEHLIASSLVSGSEVSPTALTGFSVDTPVAGVSDAWANQPIGVLIRPWPGDPDDTAGEGFWDVDNVRLTAVPEPASMALLAFGTLALTSRRRRR
jgi:hypothetical protein